MIRVGGVQLLERLLTLVISRLIAEYGERPREGEIRRRDLFRGRLQDRERLGVTVEGSEGPGAIQGRAQVLPLERDESLGGLRLDEGGETGDAPGLGGGISRERIRDGQALGGEHGSGPYRSARSNTGLRLAEAIALLLGESLRLLKSLGGVRARGARALWIAFGDLALEGSVGGACGVWVTAGASASSAQDPIEGTGDVGRARASDDQEPRERTHQ